MGNYVHIHAGRKTIYSFIGGIVALFRVTVLISSSTQTTFEFFGCKQDTIVVIVSESSHGTIWSRALLKRRKLLHRIVHLLF